jgi:hypothetical protein
MNRDSSPYHVSLNLFRILGAACLLIALAANASPQTSTSALASDKGQFNLKLDAAAIVNLRRADDRVDDDD